MLLFLSPSVSVTSILVLSPLCVSFSTFVSAQLVNMFYFIDSPSASAEGTRLLEVPQEEEAKTSGIPVRSRHLASQEVC